MTAQDERGGAPVAVADTDEGVRPQPAPRAEPETSATPQRAKRRLRIRRWVRAAEPWGVLATVLLLFLGLASFWIDYRDRVLERTVRSWQLLNTPAFGNSGKREALEYLNREDGLCLDALQGRLGWLHGNYDTSCLILLKGPTPLAGINLSPPVVIDPVLGRRWSLGAYLSDADLRGGTLDLTNLRGADLRGVDLSGAYLGSAVGLVQEQLDGACGDVNTNLPEGLTIRPCAQEPAS